MNRFPELQPHRESSLRKEERIMLNPTEFVESYASIGEKKASAPLMKLFLLGVLAGFSIGLGSVISTMVSYSVSAGLVRIVSGLFFPIGLIMVILTGAELFTGNSLMTISLLERRIGIMGLLRNWAVVYLGNFAGSLLLAAGIVNSACLSDAFLPVHTIRIAAVKCALPFGSALVLGILCNILVCIAVMCALSAKSVPGRVIGTFIPICCFVICGFEHCVANMYYVPAGLLAMANPDFAGRAQHIIEMQYSIVDLSLLTPGNFLLHNLVPVTLGNILGGCAFAALIWFCHRKKN